MPVINRIRIVNIVYDKRCIDDKTFTYYDGLDALMNLANGGGKTVMVETIFQPIIPAMNIGGWKITDYLTGDSKPSYVMIEWMLDNTKEPTYYMTGICMSVVRMTENDGQNARALKYFTFTHTYTRGNEFDVSHFPVSEMLNSKQKYYTYSEAGDVVRKYSRTHQDFRVFRKDEVKKYQDELEQNYIFDHEWRLLAKVNQAENGNGLAKLFENCKTSDALFDRWILKNIVEINREQRDTLIGQISSLSRSILNSDKSLDEKELLEGAANDLQGFGLLFSEYIKSIDNKEQIERSLAGVLKHIIICINNEADKIDAAKQQIDECKDTERRILHEQLSEDHHGITSRMHGIQSRLDKLNMIVPEDQKAAGQAEHQYKCMKAAEYYSAVKEAEAEIKAAQSIIALLQNDDKADRIKQLGATLYRYYVAEADKQNEAAKKIKQEMTVLDTDKTGTANKIAALNKENADLSITVGTLREKCSAFDAKQAEYETLIGRLPDRNIMGGMISESTEEIRGELEKAVNDAKELQGELAERLNTAKEELQDRREAIHELDKKIIEQNKEFDGLAARKEDLNGRKKQITDILAEYEISEKYVFEREKNIEVIKEKQTAADIEKSRFVREKEQVSDTLEKLRKNRLHSAPEFAEFLDKNEIEYQTGEAYLKAQSGDYYRMLLEKLPILPYCFIVSDRDYSRALTVAEEVSIDRVCPVIRMQDLNSDMEADGRTVIAGGVKLYSFYDRRSIDPETRDEYEEYLCGQTDELNGLISSKAKQLQKVAGDLAKVTEFTFSKADEDKLINDLRAAENELEHLTAQRKKAKDEEEKLLAETEQLKERISENGEALKAAENRKTKFEEYLSEAGTDLENHAELDKTNSRIETIKAELEELDQHNKQILDLKETMIKKELEANSKKEEARSKSADYSSCSEGTVIEGDVHQFEIEYETLIKQQGSEIDVQNDICRKEEKRKNANLTMLNKSFSDLSKDDYNIRFDQDKLQTLEKARDDANAKLAADNAALESCQNQLKNITEELNNKTSELSRKGFESILSPEEIIGNYTERRNENDRKSRQAEEIKTNAEMEKEKLISKRTEVQKLISEDLLNDNSVKESETIPDISLEKTRLFEAKEKAKKTRNAYKKRYTEIRSKYIEKTEWIADILAFIDPDNAETYNECYYLYTQLEEKQKLLNDQITLLKTELENVENDRRHIITQVREYAEFLYDQVRKISSNSYINLNGSRKKILEIKIPDKLDDEHRTRIESFVNDAINKLRAALSGDVIETEIYQKVSELFPDRGIFNAVIGSSSMVIKVWKSLRSEKNSRLENWESRYSGGEHFLVYFVVYASLVAYARKRQTSEDTDNIRSVFIVDNPFGETSSEHLLKVFVEVAKKFKLQTICFSDLKQDSITGQFDLIYQLSLREAAYTNKSYLTVEEVINNAKAEENTSLEYVSMRGQLSFLN